MSKVKVNDALPDFKVTTSMHDDVKLSSIINKKSVFWIIRYKFVAKTHSLAYGMKATFL